MGSHSEASEHNHAENLESLGSNSGKNEVVAHGEAPEPRIHPVLVTIRNDGNATRFLSNLLINLQYVDESARILAHPEASSKFVPIQRTTDIPTDESARRFVYAYILNVKVTPKGDMKGKVWIQSQAKFSNIKRNTRFLQWLDGNPAVPNEPRIELMRSEMQGTTIIATGIFLNVVTRFDLVKNFQDQIANALKSTIAKSGPIPEFQIEPSQVHGKTGITRLYKMLTSSVEFADVLHEKMSRIMPSPTQDISYISYRVWALLPNPKKLEYYAMQKNFTDNHSALLLRGVRNPYAIMGKVNEDGTQPAGKGKEVTIATWLTMLLAVDGYTLFPKVFPNAEGEIELWHHTSHNNEAKAWATTALAEIARLSRIDITTNKDRAEAMFLNPAKVKESIDKLKKGVSIPKARSECMEFQPPATNSVNQGGQRQNQRSKRRAHGGYNNVKLVFDIDSESATQVSTMSEAETAASRRSTHWSKKTAQRSGASTGGASSENKAQDTTEEGLAKAAAAKAIQTADTLTKKFPSKGKTAHQGAYTTLEDKFGNRIPVVAVDGKWVVLTERSLIESRKQEKPANFGISARASHHETERQQTRKAPRNKSSRATAKKMWGDEDSSDDEWTKEMNTSLVSTRSGGKMDTDTEEEEVEIVFTAAPEQADDKEMSKSLAQQQQQAEEEKGTAEDEESDDVIMTDTTTAAADEPAYFDVEEDKTRKGSTFVDAASQQLFSAEMAQNEPPRTTTTAKQSTNTAKPPPSHQSGKPETVAHNAEPPGKMGTSKRRGHVPKATRDAEWTEWQKVQARNQKRRNTQGELPGQQQVQKPASIHTAAVEVASDQPTISDVSMDTIQMLEKRNEQLEKRNDKLASMMEENQRQMQELSMQHGALLAAMAALTTKSPQQKDKQPTESDQSGSVIIAEANSATMAQTPEKKRTSKKTSLAPVVGRTPPKPPEGTPQRKKKKKVSESPTSLSTSNRYAPLASDNADEEDSSAVADESHELESAKKADEKDDAAVAPQAAATHQTTQQESPGPGSNGAGSLK